MEINSPVFPIVPSYDAGQKIETPEIYLNYLKKVEIIMTTAGTSQFNLLNRDEINFLNYECNNFEGEKILGLKDCSQIREDIKTYNGQDYEKTALMFTYPERYYDDRTITEYFFELADLSHYPVFVHCLPIRHGRGGTYCYTADLINKICQHENIIGIKEETPDLMQAYNICNSIDKDHCQIIVAGGSQRRFRFLVHAGARSFLAGIGSIFPSEDLNFFNSPDIIGYYSPNEDMLFDVFFKVGWHPSLRYALKIYGLISGQDRMPFYQLTEKERQRIEALLAAIERDL